MPVVTKNQTKNAVVAKQSTASVIISARGLAFISEMKELLLKPVKGNENKMLHILEVYEKLHNNLSRLIAVDGLDSWIKFVATVYLKTSEYIRDRDLGYYFAIDKNIVEKFLGQVFLVRNFTSNIIKNYSGYVLDDNITIAKEEIARLESGRPRRNIPRVNYTGMDSIEADDDVTDIWQDLTIQNDPDYEYEDDEDDEDDDEEDDEEEVTRRSRRKIPKVNYTGMDMNEDDKGTIHVSKRWFENGKVKYIWKSYSLSQANEIGDEDYVDEA